MKTKEEAANKWACDNYKCGKYGILNTAEDSFIAGAEWQKEQIGWIDVNDKLPEIRDDFYQVLCKNANGIYFLHDILTHGDEQTVKDCFTHFKYID